MKVTGFDGRQREWNLGRKSAKYNTRKCSSLHKRARVVLRELFPRTIILEEVHLPGSATQTRSSTLFADFYIPSRQLVVEVHGRQHYEFNEFYHKTKRGYQKSRARDRDKIKWCGLNEIDIVGLSYKGKDEEWKESILDR